MKALIKSLLVVILAIGVYDSYAACGSRTDQDYITALKNADYEVRNQTLIDLDGCSDLSKPEIQQAILKLVDREIAIDTQWYRDYRAGKHPAALGEGYGEYLIDLQKTLFNISANPKTMDALLASRSISGWAIEDRLIETYGEKLVPGLLRQFYDKTMWDKDNLKILRLVARLNKLVKLSNDSRKQLRRIVMGGLSFSSSPYTQRYAIEDATYMGFDDNEIVAKINEISSQHELLKEPAAKALAILRRNRKVLLSSSTVSVSTITSSLLTTTTGQASK
jgi:hypothetical protein